MLDKKQIYDTLRTRQTYVLAGVFAVIVLLSGYFLADANSAYRRNAEAWKGKVIQAADSKAQDINIWFENQFSGLKSLADNESLRIYFSELLQYSGDASKIEAEPYQAVYLRGLLSATAKNLGFYSEGQSQINASVDENPTFGMVLLSNDMKPLSFTSPAIKITGELEDFIESNFSKDNATIVIPSKKGSLAETQVAFLTRIYATHKEKEPENQVGAVLAVRPLSGMLNILTGDALIDNSAEILMLGDNYVYSSNFGVNTALSVEDGVKAFAKANPVSFGEVSDYNSNDVLTYNANLKYLPWQLIYKVDTDSALLPYILKQRIVLISIALALVVFGFAAYILSLKSSYRKDKNDFDYKNIAMELGGQNVLLKKIIDNCPEDLYVVDANNNCLFMNSKLSARFYNDGGDNIGRNLRDIFDENEFSVSVELNRKALSGEEGVSDVRRFVSGGKECVKRSIHIPFEGPIGYLVETGEKVVLVVEQNISSIVSENEKMLANLHFLVDALVKVLDNRDKYTADHSARVSELAVSIAEEMDFSEDEKRTLGIAGKLMNIGKAVLPLELLQKSGKISDVEKKQVRESVLVGANLLEGIEFNGPVRDIIRQSGEFMDGTGMLGLKSEEISLPARVLAVANAFVSMCSPRAYRAKKTVTEAMQIILEGAESKYDRSVVAALISYMENSGGRENWQIPEEIESIVVD